MIKVGKKRTVFVLLAVLVVVGVAFVYFWLAPRTASPKNPSPTPTKEEQKSDAATQPAVTSIQGQTLSVGGAFTITVPNGWKASVSTQPSFLAVMFARPGQINTLAYDQAVAPAIDYSGIPAWSGLTEHFYVRSIPTPAQAFNPADHAEVTSTDFTFDDGTMGTKYSVTKHAAEAEKWGGLLKDSEWYGRVYVYKKGERTVEAHVAYYPSTKIDTDLFERVAKTISL